MSLSIKVVKDFRDWKQFMELPWKINGQDKNWVPPLKMSLRETFHLKKNPFWKTASFIFFIALREDEPVGRIMALVLNGREQESKPGFFGFIEALNEGEVFALLLQRAEQWLKEKGCVNVTGPLNPGINYELGILTKGFDHPPYVMLSHNPSYYDALMQQQGYAKEKDFFSYRIHSEKFHTTDKIKRATGYLLKRKPIRIRNANVRDFNNELKIFHEIYNDAFDKHWGFIPMHYSEFEYMARGMLQIMDPDLVLILEYAGEPAGFILTLPNINEVLAKIRDGKLFPFGIFKFLYYKRKIKTVRVLTVAVKKKFQALGLGSFLYLEVARKVAEKGYTGGEMSWVAEDNLPMNKAAREMGGEVYKQYRVYKKKL